MSDHFDSESGGVFVCCRRISPTERDCIEGLVDGVWKPLYWCMSDEAIINLVMDRDEGCTVEGLTNEMIDVALHRLRRKAKVISDRIAVLEKALDVKTDLGRRSSPENP